MDSFRRTKQMLSKALKGSVDSMFIGFRLPKSVNLTEKWIRRTLSSICGIFTPSRLLLGHLGSTQGEISSARTALLEAKEALGSKRADLVQLWNRGQMLEEMIKLLDQMYVPYAIHLTFSILIIKQRALEDSP